MFKLFEKKKDTLKETNPEDNIVFKENPIDDKLQDENIKFSKRIFAKGRLKKGEIYEIVHDGDIITHDQRNILMDHFQKLYEAGESQYSLEMIKYIESNKVFSEVEIYNIHEDAWHDIQKALNEIIQKNSNTNSSRLLFYAKKFMKNKKYYQPRQIPEEKEYYNGETYSYFSIRKTLENNNMLWISRIISMDRLERWTYDVPLLNEYTRKIQIPSYTKYNKMTDEQRLVHNFKKRILKLSVISILIFSSIFFFVFYSKPRIEYKKAQTYFSQQEYSKAYTYFLKSNFKDSFNRAGLSLEREYSKKNQFDKALDILNKMEKKKISFNDVLLSEEIKSVKYNKAVYLFSKKEYIKAQPIFFELKNYMKSKEYYNKCTYNLAEDFLDYGKEYDALYEFSKIKGYMDSSNRFNSVGDGLYSRAISLYNENKYKDAQDIFKKISKSNYKESRSMVNQCTYRYSLDLINSGKYIDANKNLNGIKNFKDSSALLNEATYRYAKNLFESDPIKSIPEFEKIDGFKDSRDFLSNPKIVLYGQWTIKQINDMPVENTTLKIYNTGAIDSNKELPNIRLSKNTNEQAYRYKEKNIFSIDEKIYIEVLVKDINNIEIVTHNDTKKTNYLLEREYTLYEMLDNENKIKDVFKKESKNSQINELIREYINKIIKAI